MTSSSIRQIISPSHSIEVMKSLHGNEVLEKAFGDVPYFIQQLNVGWAYAVPSVHDGWRRSNNELQAAEHAEEEIRGDAPDVMLKNGRTVPGRDWHAYRHSSDNHGSAEHMFALQTEIQELKSELAELKGVSFN